MQNGTHLFFFSGFKKLQSGSESSSKMVVLGHPFQKDVFHQPSVSILRGKLLFLHFEQLNLLSIHLFFGLICKQANQYYRFGHFAAVVHKTTMMSIEQPRGQSFCYCSVQRKYTWHINEKYCLQFCRGTRNYIYNFSIKAILGHFWNMFEFP